MSEKFGPENVGSKYGEPVEGDTQTRILSEELLESKKEEYMKKAVASVLELQKTKNPYDYQTLQANLKMKMSPVEYNDISEQAKEILENFVDYVKKQIYIDGYEAGGEKYPIEKNPREMDDFSRVVADYSDDDIERVITNELTR